MIKKRRISHLTPRYVYNRLGVLIDERLRPDNPWLTAYAVRLLETMIRPTDTGIEFGSGRSTLWIGKRLRHLTSVEHDIAWHSKVQNTVYQAGLSNRVDCRLAQDDDSYLNLFNELGDSSVDFCLIDGRLRDECAIRMLPKLRPGSLLVVDNVNRYLPNDKTHSPDSRRHADGCASGKWSVFNKETENWRYVWTSNGITDTALYICPSPIH